MWPLINWLGRCLGCLCSYRMYPCPSWFHQMGGGGGSLRGVGEVVSWIQEIFIIPLQERILLKPWRKLWCNYSLRAPLKFEGIWQLLLSLQLAFCREICWDIDGEWWGISYGAIDETNYLQSGFISRQEEETALVALVGDFCQDWDEESTRWTFGVLWFHDSWHLPGLETGGIVL